MIFDEFVLHEVKNKYQEDNALKNIQRLFSTKARRIANKIQKKKNSLKLQARLAVELLSSSFVLNFVSSITQSFTSMHTSLRSVRMKSLSKIDLQVSSSKTFIRQNSTHIDSLSRMKSKQKEKKRAANMFDDILNEIDFEKLVTFIKNHEVLKITVNDLITLYLSLLFTAKRLDVSLLQESRMTIESYDLLEKIEKAANNLVMKRNLIRFLSQMIVTHEEAQRARDAT